MAVDAGTGRASPGKLAILYDGQCGMCRASLARIRRFDASGKIEPMNLHSPQARAKFPDLTQRELLEELHAINDEGTVYRGARAIHEILRLQPGVRGWLACLWYLPGYPWLASCQYRRIARRRYRRNAQGRFGSEASSCAE